MLRAEQRIKHKTKQEKFKGQKNKKSRRMKAVGILLAMLAGCTGCRGDEINRAAVNLAVPGFLLELPDAASGAAAPAFFAYRAILLGRSAYEAAAQEAEAAAKAREEEEPEGGFYVTYQGYEAPNFIEFRHCDCVYDADDIQIYAEYLYWLMVPDAFPYNQYVLYIRTPQEELQLYPVKDFLVDEEHGILYTKIAGDDGFESVRSMSFMEKDAPMLDSGREVFNAGQAEEMLSSAYEADMEKGAVSGQSLFSNITVELTEVCTGSAELPGRTVNTDGSGFLKGEVGGIEKATGQRYYAEWEFSPADGALASELCVPKQYDPIKDKEDFAACSEIFERIEQGDWSDVKPIEKQYLWRMDVEEWLRMDVNGDGMPELVGGWVVEELPEYEDRCKIEISIIFAYQDGMAEMVYVDECDGMEFLFITAYGELVYEWGVSAGPCTNIFRRCRFDSKWNKEYLDTLVRYKFVDGEEEEYYREYYPDTYGVGGSGVYCLRERPKTEEELKHNDDGKYTVREYLTEEEFLKMYEDWTGWDFYKAQWLY